MKKALFYNLLLISASYLFSCSRPIARFSMIGEQKVLEQIQFQNESQKAANYEWNFGDGNTSTLPTPNHQYKASGNYTITLKAIDEKGKSKMTEQDITITPPSKCLVELETAYGSMLIQLYDDTPLHQDNFIKLAEEGYYDSLLFHRVINGFMLQGGDPNSRHAKTNQSLGSGGPGYMVDAEFRDSLVHVKGALAAARTGDAVNPQKRSSGSQFYIVQGQKLTEDMLARIEAQKGIRYTKAQRDAYLANGGTPFLDREYTVFGQVIEGMEVIDKIAAVKTNPGDRPAEDVWMKVRVIR
ncbi:MAG TPA: peptidylprolyl isomerase [Saprospiraceae bacterium]|nr:peptidylprolyl isomerase [Saprospiraceae bacterium]HMQ84726.1 peptidylprolyl isomerase [Saprospiraceae bacterium]